MNSEKRKSDLKIWKLLFGKGIGKDHSRERGRNEES